jgi:hypothetical protein
MDLLHLNQARKFIVQHLLVIQPAFGRDQFQDFYTFFKKELENSSNPSWERLRLVFIDHGKIFELLSALSAFEKTQIPCQFDLYHYKSSGLCTCFVFHNATKPVLERFLDHLSCFSALYLKDVSQDLAGSMLLLSQSMN